MEHMKKYKFTLIGLLISVTILLYTLTNDVDLFEKTLNYLHKLEVFEVDEFIIPSFIFGLFVLFDMLKLRKEYKVEHEKIKIYKAMMSSTHHVLNNFLNQMQLFKITAESIPDFDPDILVLYDQIMKDANEQIDALGSITSIDEVSIRSSVTPKSTEEVITQRDTAADAEKPHR